MSPDCLARFSVRVPGLARCPLPSPTFTSAHPLLSPQVSMSVCGSCRRCTPRARSSAASSCCGYVAPKLGAGRGLGVVGRLLPTKCPAGWASLSLRLLRFSVLSRALPPGIHMVQPKGLRDDGRVPCGGAHRGGLLHRVDMSEADTTKEPDYVRQPTVIVPPPLTHTLPPPRLCSCPRTCS